MAVTGGPDISTDNLQLYFDMENRLKSWRGKPTTNFVNALTTAISRYNNPGFSGTVVNTGDTFRGFPIYETTFIPQDSSFIPRLASTEGFGALHSMGTPLSANTRYMASIYFKLISPLQSSVSQGFGHTYSNIPGWGANGTSATRFAEDGWVRLYSQYFNNQNGYATRVSAFQTNFTVNTTSTETVDVNFTVPSIGTGIIDFTYLYAIVSANPTIVNNGGLTGLSIVNHGLNTTTFEKLSWPSVIKLKESDLPFDYFVRLSVPSTGGVNTTIALRANFTGYYTALTDSKYWKITFDTTGVQVGQTLRAQWCMPMIEEHSVLYPSTFVNGTRTTSQAIVDITNNFTLTANDLAYTNDGRFAFDGADSASASRITTSCQYEKNQSFSLSAWVFKTTNPGSSNFYTIMGGEIGNNISMGLVTRDNNRIEFHAYDVTDKTLAVSANDALPLNQWAYVVGTVAYDGATTSPTSGTVKIYVNGQVVVTNTFTSLTTYNRNLIIGSPVNNTLNRAFAGTIANCQVHTRELSPAEILQNFNALRSRFGV